MNTLKNFQVTVETDFNLDSDQRTILVGTRRQALQVARSSGRERTYRGVIVAPSRDDMQFNLPASADVTIREI